jgi:hypothetical protein
MTSAGQHTVANTDVGYHRIAASNLNDIAKPVTAAVFVEAVGPRSTYSRACLAQSAFDGHTLFGIDYGSLLSAQQISRGPTRQRLQLPDVWPSSQHRGKHGLELRVRYRVSALNSLFDHPLAIDQRCKNVRFANGRRDRIAHHRHRRRASRSGRAHEA